MRFACGCSRDETGQRVESCPKPGSGICTAEREDSLELPGFYEHAGAKLGKMLDEKQQRYGDSFHRAHEVLRILYPHGIPVEHYHLMMFMCRSLDKYFRLATGGPDQEDPINDLAGYALLMSQRRA